MPLTSFRLAAAWLVLFATVSTAQDLKLECSGDVDTTCKATVGLPDELQRAEIRIQVKDQNGRLVPGALVRLRPSGGVIQPDSVVADANGLARAIWFRGKGSDVVAIAAEARLQDAAGVRLIQITPAKPGGRSVVLTSEGGFLQSWFEKTQLPDELKVGLRDTADQVLNEKDCAGHKLVFKARGAPQSVSPDTAESYFEPGTKRRFRKDTKDKCLAEAYWTVGEGIGERRLDVKLLPAAGFKAHNELEAEAWTRATPRFIAGFGYNRLRTSHIVVAAKERTIKVERSEPAGTISFDSTVTTSAARFDSVTKNTVFNVIAGVSLPIPIAAWEHFDGLSITGGVDLGRPTERHYLGFSLLRFIGGPIIPVIETIPVDVHVLSFWAKVAEVEGPCAPADCRIRHRTRYQSIAWMFSADATSLVSELVDKLTGK